MWSSKNFLRPLSVSGWFNKPTIEDKGAVTTSEPILAQSIICILCLIEAERISLSESLCHFQDTDIAEESTALIKEQIRQQSAGAMVTQANSQAQFALSLLP